MAGDVAFTAGDPPATTEEADRTFLMLCLETRRVAAAEASVKAGDFGDGTPEEVEAVTADAFGGADEEDDTVVSWFFEASLINFVLVNTAVGVLAVVGVTGAVDLDTLEALEIVADVIDLVAGVTGLVIKGLLTVEEAAVLETPVVKEMVVELFAEEILAEVSDLEVGIDPPVDTDVTGTVDTTVLLPDVADTVPISTVAGFFLQVVLPGKGVGFETGAGPRNVDGDRFDFTSEKRDGGKGIPEEPPPTTAG